MIGARIKQARVAAGMTQDEVIAALDVRGVSLTKGGLSKYERGGSNPKPTLLRALAKVLGVEATFFLSEPTVKVRWLAFRKGSQMTRRRQEQVKALAESQLEAVLELRHALEPGQAYTFPPVSPVRDAEDIETAAESLRAHWKLGEQPIESVTATIEDGGGVVVEAGSEDELFDALSGWANETTPVVVVSAAVTDDRKRFSLAHELGHLFMQVEGDPKTEERFAQRFAAAFLVPAASARRELGERRRHLDFRELALLKRKHGLSMQAWLFRASDLDIIPESHARTLHAEMGTRGWKRVEPEQFEGNEKPLKLRQMTIRALAEGLISRQQAERIYPGVTADLGQPPAGKMPRSGARELLALPPEERDAILSRAAEIVAEDYEDGGNLAGLEMFSEEDYFDEPVDES